MADGTKATFDVSGWTEGLNRLLGPARVSLARSMAVAGGEVLRDEAKARAPLYVPGQGKNGKPQRVNKKSAQRVGALRDAIYLAFSESRSTDAMVSYAITWNASKAPHGHLVEFGHWFVLGPRPRKGKKDDRARIKWVPAYPFLRPAFDASRARAQQAMIARGRVRLPEVLAGAAGGAGDEL